ncbi:MAG: EAL domain-containing protein [Candidatus Baltobacteraceae bacterium]
MQVADERVAEARAERDRRIIQETAALLSADYPLDQLIERLCDGLAASLGASVSYVALPGSDRAVRLSYFNDHGTKKRPGDFVIPRGSHTHNVFVTGRSTLKRHLTDWSKSERFALNPDRPESDDSVSAIWVPIKYGDEVLGVLSVQSTQPEAFDADDIRLLEAVARYLAIAVRNQRALRVATRPFRGMRRTVASMAAIAMAVSLAVFAFYSYRAHQYEVEANALQTARARNVVDGLERYLFDAKQLAESTTALAGPLRGERKSLETILNRMVHSAASPAIYGIGAWYEPHRFSSRVRLFGPYVHRRPEAPSQEVLTYQWDTAAYNYPAQPWYHAGKSAEGAVVFTEPYFDVDNVYISASQGFADSQGFAGVVTVDTVVAFLRNYVTAQSHLPETLVYVLTDTGRLFLYPRPAELLAYARGHGIFPHSILQIPNTVARRAIDQTYGANRSEVHLPVAYTHWQVVVSTDRRAIDSGVRTLRAIVAFALLLLWVATVLAMIAVRRVRSHQLRALDLEMAQIDLHSEIATRIEAEERLRERAYHDGLTGLPNRSFLLKQLETAIAHAHRDPSFTFAVFFIDLDRFNVVNDSLGHAVGDRLLAALGRRIESRLHSNDIVARIGGDEFVVLVQNIHAESEAIRIGERLTGALTDPFYIDEQEIFMTASLGIAMSRQGYEKPEEILRDADIAMYHAKKAGRAGHQVFDRVMHDRTMMQMQLETDFRRAIAREELFLEFQPIVRLSDASVVGFEALARWRHPTRGVIYPDDFIPMAEQTRLILPMSTFVLAKAAAQIAGWRADHPQLYVLVNVSAIRFTKPGFLQEVSDVLAKEHIPPSAIRLEITESAVMENADVAQTVLGELRAFGVRSQIDDFGTGYSSLSYLQRLPIDGLKIDRSFIGAMTENPEAAEIVRAIVSLARSLKLTVIAEGIETREQALQLEALDIDYGQGFYFAEPASAQKSGDLLKRPLAVDQNRHGSVIN